MSKRGRRIAAKKGWATRRAHQRKAQRAARARTRARETEKRKIEKLLGEEFNSLAEAKRAMKEETIPFVAPADADIDSADDYDRYYQQYDDFGGQEFEDQGEIDAGVDY